MHLFTLTREDFTALHEKLCKNIQQQRRGLNVVFGLKVALWAATAYSFLSFLRAYDTSDAARYHLTHVAFGAGAAFVIWWSAYMLEARQTASRLISEAGWFLSPQQLAIEQNGIHQVSKLGATTWSWSAFLWITEDQERFYLFTEPGQGLVIPKRAVPELELQELIRSNVASKV
jgi:YcxB-like protein